jgi:hypothetical protein
MPLMPRVVSFGRRSRRNDAFANQPANQISPFNLNKLIPLDNRFGRVARIVYFPPPPSPKISPFFARNRIAGQCQRQKSKMPAPNLVM